MSTNHTDATDGDYRNGIGMRQCSCGTLFKKADYAKHLKDGSHNKVIESRRSPSS